MNEIHLSCISQGFAFVDRGDHRIGSVSRIDWPSQLDNGEIITEKRWEARRPWESAIVNPYGFPVFKTRKEAVNYLAEN